MYYAHDISRPRFIQPSMTPLRAAKEIAATLKRDIALLVDMGADASDVERVMSNVADLIEKFSFMGQQRAAYRIERRAGIGLTVWNGE